MKFPKFPVPLRCIHRRGLKALLCFHPKLSSYLFLDSFCLQQPVQLRRQTVRCPVAAQHRYLLGSRPLTGVVVQGESSVSTRQAVSASTATATALTLPMTVNQASPSCARPITQLNKSPQ